VNRARGRIGDALHQRQVVAFEAMFLEQLSSRGMRVFRERHRQRSGGFTIEAMQHADIRLVSAFELQVLADPAQHRVF
jgi:hypothetical protein